MNSRSPRNSRKSSSNDLMRYAGLGGQIFVSLGIAVFAGYKGDQWLHLPLPLLVWLLPLAVLCVLIYKLVKDTSKQKPDDAKTKG
jgi:uncharacterized membrane protein